MSDRLSRIEARLGGIDQALADVHRRLEALEALELHPAPALPSDALSAPIETPSPLPVPGAGGPDFTGLVSLVGRTFVVLGGAYLLRALPNPAGFPGPPVSSLVSCTRSPGSAQRIAPASRVR